MQTVRPSAFHCQPWNGHWMTSPSTWPPNPRCAPRCSQYAFITVTRLDSDRHAISSVSKYFIVWTAPTATWSDQATWNHPVGFIESGGFAMDQSIVGSVKI